MILEDKYGNKLQLTVDEYVELTDKLEGLPVFLGNTKEERIEKWNKLRDAGITFVNVRTTPEAFYKGTVTSTTPL